MMDWPSNVTPPSSSGPFRQRLARLYHSDGGAGSRACLTHDAGDQWCREHRECNRTIACDFPIGGGERRHLEKWLPQRAEFRNIEAQDTFHLVAEFLGKSLEMEDRAVQSHPRRSHENDKGQQITDQVFLAIGQPDHEQITGGNGGEEKKPRAPIGGSVPVVPA